MQEYYSKPLDTSAGLQRLILVTTLNIRCQAFETIKTFMWDGRYNLYIAQKNGGNGGRLSQENMMIKMERPFSESRVSKQQHTEL